MARNVRTMRVLISGASGFIGSELVSQLRDDGHEVLKLVRRKPSNDDEVNWAPSAHMLDSSVMESVDAVVNLSGAPLAHLPWTRRYRAEILNSRVQATRTLVEAMRAAKKPPEVFLSGSAVGIYGDRPGERLTESSQRGPGFLGDVVEQWEQAATLRPPKTRLVTFRTGFVTGDGGSLAPVMALTKVGLGSRFATGGDFWPWISLYDEAAAIRHMMGSGIAGPVNLVGPVPATSDRITHYVAQRLHRWYPFVVPGAILGLALQDAAHELLLSSQRILPERLLADGFQFRHSTVEQAIDAFIPAKGRAAASREPVDQKA
ncbi:MAG: nucleoside-diphosphate sugar epimerase [Microbacteriaceae bacterium]|nr:nucleoside-diphosphate sugar epimerase [Microbacteriaceae bacterium]